MTQDLHLLSHASSLFMHAYVLGSLDFLYLQSIFPSFLLIKGMLTIMYHTYFNSFYFHLFSTHNCFSLSLPEVEVQTSGVVFSGLPPYFCHFPNRTKSIKNITSKSGGKKELEHFHNESEMEHSGYRNGLHSHHKENPSHLPTKQS